MPQVVNDSMVFDYMSLAQDPKRVFVLEMKLGIQSTMDTRDMRDAGRWMLDAGAHMCA